MMGSMMASNKKSVNPGIHSRVKYSFRRARIGTGTTGLLDLSDLIFGREFHEIAKNCEKGGRYLQRAARRAHEIAQNGYIRTVRADAARIDGEPQQLGKLEVNAGVIQLRKAKSLRGQHAVQARRIHGPGRTMTTPRAARHLVELLPVALAPGSHAPSHYVHSIHWMRRRPRRFTGRILGSPAPRGLVFRPIHILHKSSGKAFSLPVVS